MNQKIVDLVRKLLALASNNSSVEEAASALAAAQRIMSEHRIEEAMLEDAAPESPSEPIRHDVLVDDGGRRLAWWRWVVADALCRANGCQAYGSGAGRLGYIGRASDAQTVRYLFAYIVAEVERLCDAAAYAKGVSGYGRGYSTTWRNSFRVGAAAEVARRLREADHAAVAAAKASTDLARVERGLARIGDHHEALARYGREHLHLRSGSRSETNLHGGAYAAGREAGRGISLGSRAPGLPAPARALQR